MFKSKVEIKIKYTNTELIICSMFELKVEINKLIL